MWHDPCEHVLHCIHVLDLVYVQMIPAELIAHPFPVFPLPICRCSWRIGAALTYILGTDLLDLGSLSMLNILFTVVVSRYLCFLTFRYICCLLYYATTTRLVGQRPVMDLGGRRGAVAPPKMFKTSLIQLNLQKIFKII